MHDERNNHEAVDSNALNEGARVRAAADGEVSPDGQDAGRVSFERGLRESVGRVMGRETAPAELRARIEAILRETPIDEAGSQSPGVVSTPLGDTTSRSFWSRTPQWLAAAAVMGLAATLLIMGGRTTTVPSNGTIGTTQEASAGYGILAQAAGFVVREHESCDSASEHFAVRTQAEADKAALEILSEVPDVIDFPIEGLHEIGYEFAGIGRCEVPGGGASAHLLYENKNVPGLKMSLFVQVDTGKIDIEEGKSYIRRAKQGTTGCMFASPEAQPGENGRSLVVWREGGYIYYLFAPGEGCCKRARKDFHAPEPEEPLIRA